MAKETNGGNTEMQKLISEDLVSAIAAASGNLKGDAFDSFEAAVKDAEDNEDEFFNPTLSQYKEGLCINTDRRYAKIKKAKVGNSTRKAWCITCPAGYRKDGKIVYSQVFNFFPSTLRKTIQVTDENGDQVLDEKMQPIVRDGKENATWRAAQALTNSKDLLNFAIDKIFETSEIQRDFGPAVFVKQADDSRRATGHKLTSLPLFNVVTE